MKLKVGDRVAYTAEFVRNVQYGGELRGIVKAKKKVGERTLLRVDWGDFECLVAPENLCVPGPNMRFCRC